MAGNWFHRVLKDQFLQLSVVRSRMKFFEQNLESKKDSAVEMTKRVLINQLKLN
jgi:hypothetical protein